MAGSQTMTGARFRWPAHATGARFVLLRPGPGLPALAEEGSIVVESLEEAGASPKFHLSERELEIVDEMQLAAVGERVIRRRRLRARGELAPGAHDLSIDGVRVPRAVWSRAGDASRLVAAQITDLHVGSGARASRRLSHVLDEVARARPDLVLVTGDIVNNADRASQFDRARELLSAIEAPTFVVPGNHDHGFGLRAFATSVGDGWHHFARAFHAYTHFEFEIGRWTFVGFDAGPSRLSPLVRTRGLGREELDQIGEALARAHQRRRSGVVLFSHAPTRARLTGSWRTPLAGPLARMSRGARRFEELLRDAARRGQRVLHVFGHTHWTDVFELDDDHRRFVRWERARLALGPQSLEGRAALVNSASASHQTLPLRGRDHGYGFTLLELGDGAPRVEFRRYRG